MATNNVSSMCSLIDNLVTMPPDKKVQLLPQERQILVKGLDDIFETLCEYKSRCDELYKGNGNASSDEIILEIEPKKNEECEYVEDDDSEEEVLEKQPEKASSKVQRKGSQQGIEENDDGLDDESGFLFRLDDGLGFSFMFGVELGILFSFSFVDEPSLLLVVESAMV